jgi:hypothetical protein
MPYVSVKQRAYLHMHHPKLAAKWDKKYGGKIGGSQQKRKGKKTTRKRSK